MTFTKVWKEQIVKPQTRLGIWKPKQELQPREEEKDDEPCNRKLEEYADELNAKTQIWQRGIEDKMEGIYNPIPEDVACKALDMLKTIQWHDRRPDGTWMAPHRMKVGNEEYAINVNWTYERMFENSLNTFLSSFKFFMVLNIKKSDEPPLGEYLIHLKRLIIIHIHEDPAQRKHFLIKVKKYKEMVDWR